MSKTLYIYISFIIPVFNEEETIIPLYEKIVDVMNRKNISSFEILFIDDGSTDDSWNRMMSLLSRSENKKVALIRFRKNFGKSAALNAGFYQAKGDIVFTIDADLQDDPEEIPKFIEKIEEGFDLVSGWKEYRNDPLSKTIPSRIFNRVTRIITGIRLHDFNCGYKLYRKEILKSITLYGELHRYIPVLAAEAGFKIIDICRKYGISEQTFYNWRNKYSGMEISDIRRLKALTDENRKLKRLVADLSLDNQVLKDLLGKNF